jgi:hypothetical protein
MIVKIVNADKGGEHVSIIQALRAAIDTRTNPPGLTIDDGELLVKDSDRAIYVYSDAGYLVHEYQRETNEVEEPTMLTHSIAAARDYPTPSKREVEEVLANFLIIGWGDPKVVFRGEFTFDMDLFQFYIEHAVKYKLWCLKESIQAIDLLIMSLNDIIKGNRELKLVREGEYYKDTRQDLTRYNFPEFITLNPIRPFTLHMTKIIEDNTSTLAGVPAYRVLNEYMDDRYTDQVNFINQDGIWLYSERAYRQATFEQEARNVKEKYEASIVEDNAIIKNHIGRLESCVRILRDAI